jgi:hypothetical protein
MEQHTFRVKDNVRLATGTLGTVVGEYYEESHALYRVAYFVNGEHKADWFYDFELVKLSAPDPVTVTATTGRKTGRKAA